MPAEETKVEELSIKIAAENGYQFAHRTRFTNLCLLFWAAPANFVRIDIEGNVRWRIFPVISATRILRNRKRAGRFYVPSALGESLVMATKVAWMGYLSKRYGQRMIALSGELARAGAETASPAEQHILALAKADQPGPLRRNLIGRTLANPLAWPSVARTLMTDLKRILGRLLNPPGYQVTYHGTKPIDWDALSSHLSLALPMQKNYRFSGRGNPLKIFLSLFRGGLVSQEYPDNSRPAPSFSFFSSRSHRISVYRHDTTLYLAHPDSGWLREVPMSDENPALALTSFIGSVMARNCRPMAAPRMHGSFVVLVGLDGAGKTTFARNLSVALGTLDPLPKVRYHHWIPTLFRKQFPWPAVEETPRKIARNGGLQALLSVMRLIKNLLHARMIYHFGIRRWIRKGDYVVVDRFIYNYWLDPVSLRYSGPAWWLNLAARLMPKPDLIFSLETESPVLLARKKELTREEISKQTVALRNLPLRGVRKVVLDAANPPSRLVEEALQALHRDN
ncbi:MAG: hypothetical protein V4733_00620 [Verrucomicrobiota bacterium]